MDQHSGEPGERPDRTSEGFGGSGTPGGAGDGGVVGDRFDGGAAEKRFGGPFDGSAERFGTGTGERYGAAAQDQDGFDAFAPGTAHPAAGPLVPLAPSAALVPVVPTGLPALPAAPQQGTSLFDSTLPIPRMALRPVRDPRTAEAGGPGGGSVRIRRVVAGDYLLTVNPVDGTEVSLCPPEERPVPVRRTREQRAARIAAARPAPPPGPPAPELPLLEREEEKERLLRLLARGRSIRVTGPSGAGRSALLESVAHACGDLAPAGVLWLSGYRRTAADLLQDLYAIVYDSAGYRPGRAELPGLLREIGAVVVLDDLEFGGGALEDLLATAPECAFLMSATPDVPAPSPDSAVEEVFLSGLTRVACLDLLQLGTGRPLGEDETAWAADLWFESEGLPLRFVQAGALLRQRDGLRQEVPRQPPGQDRDDCVWQKGAPDASGEAGPGMPGRPDRPGLPRPLTGRPGSPPGRPAFDQPGAGARDAPAEPPPPAAPPALTPVVQHQWGPAADVPLPSLAQSAAPADLLASRLSESARAALAFAVALDGECPHASHLPALVGDTHGDAALGELTSVGLAVPVSSHFRLATGVAQQLAAALAAPGGPSDAQAHTAALHYAWWTGHPSVSPEQAAAESEAILAAMSACRDRGHPSTAVLLARTVAPVFAAALHWGAWERALRVGQEAARLCGEVAEEAYFHHELGVLALCSGHPDRARAELEASIALRAALADRQGTVVGRRTLALIDDHTDGGSGSALELLPPAATATAGTPSALPRPDVTTPLAVIGKRTAAHAAGHGSGPRRLGAHRLTEARSRRNLVAAGSGALLAAALGTIVTLGATSGGGSTPNQVQPVESVQQDAPDGTTLPAQDATTDVPPSPSPAATTAAPPPPSTTGADLTTPPSTRMVPPRTTPPVTAGHRTTRPPTHTTKPPPTTAPGTPPATPPPTSPPPTTPTTPPITQSAAVTAPQTTPAQTTSPSTSPSSSTSPAADGT